MEALKVIDTPAVEDGSIPELVTDFFGGLLVLAGQEERGDDVREALAPLSPDAFAEDPWHTLAKAIWEVHEAGLSPDAVSVAEWLSEGYELETIGGREFLAELVDNSTGIHVVDRARQLAKEWKRRQDEQARVTLLQLLKDPHALASPEKREWARTLLASADADELEPQVRTLREIIDAGETEAPETVIPRIAWRGRVSMLAAMEKDGKSTLAQAGVAAATRGAEFLGESAVHGTVLYLALDEAVGDAGRRLVRFGADQDRVYVVDRTVGDPAQYLDRLAREHRPDLVVVDTLQNFAADVVKEASRPDDWVRLLKPVCLTARDTGAGILLLHHSKKSDKKYRDSTAIGGSVDVILEMKSGIDSEVRDISARGRWPLSNFSVRLVGNLEDPDAHLRYELDGGELSLDARLLLFIENNPGCTARDIRRGVTGRAQDITATVTELERRGAVEDRGSGMSRALYAAKPGHTPDTLRDTVGDTHENP